LHRYRIFGQFQLVETKIDMMHIMLNRGIMQYSEACLDVSNAPAMGGALITASLTNGSGYCLSLRRLENGKAGTGG
jgi:hypothetical protein